MNVKTTNIFSLTMKSLAFSCACKLLILMALLMPLVSSCNVMDVESEDSIPADKAFKDKKGIEQGILGSYDALQSLSYYGRTFSILPDLSSDDLKHPSEATSTDYAEVDGHVILPENSAVEGIWNSIYNTINTANSVIVKVPGMSDMTEEEKNNALGELYFIRALCHFNLVNLFGAVPIKTSPTVGVSNLNAKRDAVEEVYNQIITDLIFAAENLPASTSTKVRATQYAAKALLARVYLYEKNYSAAYQKANDVLQNGGYTFVDNYADIFAADGSAETIFEIDFASDDRNRIAEYNFPKTLNGRYEVAPSALLISAFSSSDARKNVTIAFDGVNAYAKKYDDLSTGADNVIILRLAEMYLIRAEAQAHMDNPVIKNIQDDINAIRNRAGLDNTSASTVSELLTALEDERRLEFAFEGHRWFDLVRTGRATTVIDGFDDNRMTLYPIPSSEVLTNNLMTQNPGY
jgi:hypothetical protein